MAGVVSLGIVFAQWDKIPFLSNSDGDFDACKIIIHATILGCADGKENNIIFIIFRQRFVEIH